MIFVLGMANQDMIAGLGDGYKGRGCEYLSTLRSHLVQHIASFEVNCLFHYKKIKAQPCIREILLLNSKLPKCTLVLWLSNNELKV